MPPDGPESPLFADDELLQASLETILAEGPDALSLSGVAGLLDRDLSDLTETYGHPGELLAQVWSAYLSAEWDDIISIAERLFLGEVQAAEQLRQNIGIRRAAVHVAIVAHRYDELAEVVPHDIARKIAVLRRRRFETSAGRTDEERSADDSVLLGLLGWILGSLLDPQEVRSLSHLQNNGWHTRCWKTSFTSPEAPRLPPRSLVFDQAGPLSQDLLAASTRIVAQGGMSRATLSRVARLSGYPPEVVVGMYLKQENLLSDFIETAVNILFGSERIDQALRDPDLGSMQLAVWLEPAQVNRRRALLEILMSGAFSPTIRVAYIRAVQLADSSTDVISADFRLRAAIVREVCFGLAVVRDAIGDFGITDWRSFAHSALAMKVAM